MFLGYSTDKFAGENRGNTFFGETRPGNPWFHLDRYASFKIFNFFGKTRLTQHLRVNIKGLKFVPTVTQQKKSNHFTQFFKKFEHSSSDQTLGNQVFYTSPSIKYITHGALLRNQLPAFSAKIERRVSCIEFEESADEIKVHLTSTLVKLCISRNFLVGRCWLTVKSAARKNKEFWYLYLASCYNFMTKLN